jgi:hypothetical protein
LKLTEEQILALAPDESSKKSGKDLSNAGIWVTLGVNDMALWGECQGSGSKPYRTQVDVNNIAFKCSCPSRKFPCKHGLGLLLLYLKNGGNFTDNTAPEWVIEWLNKRIEKVESKTAKEEKPVDEVAQAKRREARENVVEDGINELLLWMKDIIRNGILLLPEKGAQFFIAMSRRLIDAKAPGLAGMVKNLGNINFYSEGWQSQFIDHLVQIYLVITGFKNKETLSPLLLEDIRSSIGFTQAAEVLKQQTGVIDLWFVLGKQTTEEDGLVTERNWLYGTNTHRYALVLQFIVRGQGISFSLTPGIVLEAELVFYESAQPMRAMIRKQIFSTGRQAVTPFKNWQQVAETETLLNTQLPFRSERPFIIQNIILVQFAEKWWLADSEQNIVQLKGTFKHLYTILSLSGGKALQMTVLGKENIFEPLGIWNNDYYTTVN